MKVEEGKRGGREGGVVGPGRFGESGKKKEEKNINMLSVNNYEVSPFFNKGGKKKEKTVGDAFAL